MKTVLNFTIFGVLKWNGPAEVFSLSILVGKGADIKCKGEESVEVG